MKNDNELSKLPELQAKLKDEYYGAIWDNIEPNKEYVMIESETDALYSVKIITVSADKKAVNAEMCNQLIGCLKYTKWYTYLQFMNELFDEIPKGAK